MQVTTLSEVRPRPRRVAMGQFDGVHLGHREVIAGNDTVLTFEPHPLAVTRPQALPKLLTTLEEKTELIAGLGVQELVVIPFDEEFAVHSPQWFIDEVLVGRLGATHVSVGQNFRFGHNADGDPQLLAADGRFETRVVTLVELDGHVVSSSQIRTLVAAGNVERAGRLLGAPFAMRGVVVAGDRRGRDLGFPTANIVPDRAMVCPGYGVYAARANGVCAAVSVGVRPTFGEDLRVLVEAHLLDQDVDLYGREMRIEFLSFLRGEERFDSVAELVAQMERDVEQTRAHCA